MSNHHVSAVAWWERPELLIQRRVMQANYGQPVHLPHEGLYTVIIEQLPSGQHRATFTRASFAKRAERWTIYLRSGLDAIEAPGIIKPFVAKLACDLPALPGVYDARRSGEEWAVTKRAGKRKAGAAK